MLHRCYNGYKVNDSLKRPLTEVQGALLVQNFPLLFLLQQVSKQNNECD